MIVGIGVDLVEVARLARALARQGTRFERRVFTEAEIAACHERTDRDRALAARFAAKEACLKALGTGWSGGLGFSQIEVVRGVDGQPAIALHGKAAALAKDRGIVRVHVSLTHESTVAAAVVVLEGTDQPSAGS